MIERIVGALFLMLILPGCQTIDNDEDVAAVIVSHNEASIAEVRYNINSALGTEVLVSESAFAESSSIAIEKRLPSTMERQGPIGRDYSTPVRFNLVKRGVRCYLIDTRNNTRYLLESTTCRPE